MEKQIQPPKGMPSAKKAGEGEFTKEDFQNLSTETDRKEAKSLYQTMVKQTNKAKLTNVATRTAVTGGIAIGFASGKFAAGIACSVVAGVAGVAKEVYHNVKAENARDKLNAMKSEQLSPSAVGLGRAVTGYGR